MRAPNRRASGAFLLVAVALTVGCSHSRSEESPNRPVTYWKDIAPVFYAKCLECHRQGEVAPMPLITYEDARPWAESIVKNVATRAMPPWHADPSIGHFANDRSLTAAEIKLISQWVEQGANEGDPKEAPKVPSFEFGKDAPYDEVFAMDEEFVVPATGVVPWKHFVTRAFDRDRWIVVADVKPSNRAVVHHIAAVVIPPELTADLSDPKKVWFAMYNSRLVEEGSAEAAAIHDGIGFDYLPGKAPFKTPEGYALRVTAGSRLVIQVHYVPNGKEQRDRSEVRLRYGQGAKYIPFSQLMLAWPNPDIKALRKAFLIPAGLPDYVVDKTTTFTSDGRLFSLTPHMHLRGKSAQYFLEDEKGSRPILSVPNYDFNWQTTYEFKEPIQVKKGDRLRMIFHYDNSSRNRFNPDPAKEVRSGMQTTDEMYLTWMMAILNSKAPAVANRP